MDTLERMLATMHDTFRAMGRGRARWEERDGVGALITPFVAHRSIVNCVVCKPGADLEGAYDWLEHEYAGKVVGENLDATTARNEKIVQELGFESHGIVIRSADGKVLWKEADHTVKMDDVRQELDRLLKK